MRGVIVTPQPLAADVGAEVLRSGGNAFDAAVAAGFMQAATDPFMCGIGGMGVAQVYCAETGENVIVDFYGRMGSRGRPDMWADRVHETAAGKQYVEGFLNDVGYRAILIPGTVAGLGTLHERWGTRPWGELLQPAIRVLRQGYPLFAYIADYFHYPFGDYTVSLIERVHATAAMAELWLRNGVFPAVGDVVTLPDYASTLERLAEAGWTDFYDGAIGDAIAADFEANGALITKTDLAGFRPRLHAPVEVTYRGYTVRSDPAPGGGPTIEETLNIMEGYAPVELGHNSPEYSYSLASALKLAFIDRKKFLGDAEFVAAPLDHLLDKAYAVQLRDQIATGKLQGTPADPDHGTTHLTVADEAGNVVAMTHTLATGSGVATPGLGFQYNNSAWQFDPEPGHPNSVAVDKARLTSMAPTLLFKEGRPVVALGSPGSNAIASAIVQVIMNVVDFGMTPVEAVSATRLHCEGGPVMCETRLPSAVVDAMVERGHQVSVRPYGYDTLQGRVQLVVRADADTDWLGASDPRRDGGTAVYSR